MNRPDDLHPGEPSPIPADRIDSTAMLIGRIREGDREARERLFARCLPRLQQWAHRRLPARARDIADTDDLVQVALLKALHRIGEFQAHREGAFLAYLRTILLNAVRDELRRKSRRPEMTELDDELRRDDGPSVLDDLIGRELVRGYEAALDRLNEEQREAIILRIEFGMSHREIADAMGKPNADAARMTVARALVHLRRALDSR
jgi:RNA polymerase sigma-70 factor (ECF subfamily)